MTDPRQARTHLQEGLRLLAADQLEEALDLLDRALGEAEGMPAEVYALVPSWHDGPAWTPAVDALQAALERHDDDEDLRAYLGRVFVALGCPRMALDTLGEGSEDDDVPLLVARAAALDALGRRRDARKAWRRVRQVAPEFDLAQRRLDASHPAHTEPVADDDDGAAVRYALALFRDGRFEEAEALLTPLAHDDATPDVWIAMARIHHAQGHTVDGIAALQQVDPSGLSARTRIALADATRSLGQPNAVALYDAARTEAPDDLVVLSAVADGLQRLGDQARAKLAADAALDLAPTWLPAMVARARALAAMGEQEAARKAWHAVLEAQPGHPEAVRGVDAGKTNGEPGKTERGVARIHHDLGRSMLQRGRFREAIHAFRNAVEIRPDWADPWRQLGQTFLQLDDRAGALDAFRQALEHDPEDTESAVRLGDLYRDQGALQLSRSMYDLVISRQGDNLRARVGRGETLRLLSVFDEAVVDHEAALQIDPDEPSALSGLAASLNGLGRFAEARPVWVRAREHDPNSTFVAKGLAQCHAGLRGSAPLPFEDVSREPQPRRAEAWQERDPAFERYEAMDHVDRGRSYHKERNYASAIDSFRKALEKDPTCDEAALRLGMAYEDDRQFRRAIAAYRTCLEIEPNHYQAATNIGEAYRKNEQYREAISAYDQSLALKPDYLYALAGRGECMRMLGRYEECLAWFDKALAQGGHHAFAIQGKAAALNALQRFAEASEFWTRALDLEPQSQFAADGKAYCEAQLRRIETEDGDELGEDEAESATPTLDEQGRDLTALAKAGKLPKVIGRDKEVRQVMKTLVRRLKANPLLLGEPGVGKTAVVEGLAQRLAAGEGPSRLRDLRIVELSMGTLIAGTKYRGTFEERLREIVKEAASVPGLVLFIDEIHTLVGAGRTEGGSLDAANILKPALARGEITVIGATTLSEFRQHFESDSALERRFQPITVDEPSVEACIDLLTAVAPAYERHHDVTVHPSALAACVEMAVRFLPDRRLPDKALDMLDEACAEASLADESVVDEAIVARVVSERTGVAVQKLTEADREHMMRIEEQLSERVQGQDDAIRRLADAVRLSKAGLRSPDRPRAVFLFQGPSGVGKTELAKALSEFLFPEGDALIRLDMSEYADRFTASRLLGAPPGYAGHGDEGQLTGPLRRRPYSVVLLDEFEKAHPDVQAVFLSLLDEGMLTDADGRTINAREAIFILTTNAGTSAKGGSRMGFGQGAEDDREAALAAISPFFRPELLDRIDEIVTFRDVDEDALRHIARHRLQGLSERAAAHLVSLRWDDSVVDHVLAARKRTDRGARQTIRAVDTLIGEPLGRFLLDLGDEVARIVQVRVVEGEVHFDEAQAAPKKPVPTAQA